MGSRDLPHLGAQLIRSPNCGPRKDGLQPDLIVLHYTAMADTDAVVRHLCAPEAQVSAHYVICPKGRVIQLVEEADRAWHAGAASWGGEGDVNSRSIGIELVNDGFQPFAEPQMAALEGLLPGVMDRWDIPPKGVVGHSCVAPGRKIDPGVRFDWRRLARGGLAIWPESHALPGDFQSDIKAFGVTADVSDDLRLTVFRHRFRPWAKGPLDDVDRTMAADLAARFAVDPARRAA